MTFRTHAIWGQCHAMGLGNQVGETFPKPPLIIVGCGPQLKRWRNPPRKPVPGEVISRVL